MKWMNSSAVCMNELIYWYRVKIVENYLIQRRPQQQKHQQRNATQHNSKPNKIQITIGIVN